MSKPPAVILGLDMASTTGWALYDTERDFSTMISGVWKLKEKSGDNLRKRLVRFSARLRSIPVMPDLVVYEIAHHRGGPATRSAISMVGILLEWCEANDIPDIGVYPSSLKKWAAGHGKASKDRMIAAAEGRVGHEVTSDDEADAILLACFGAEEREEVENE